jgi:hypothetical protein
MAADATVCAAAAAVAGAAARWTSVGGSFPRRWQLTDWADLRLDGARGTQVSIGGRSLDGKSWICGHRRPNVGLRPGGRSD